MSVIPFIHVSKKQYGLNPQLDESITLWFSVSRLGSQILAAAEIKDKIQTVPRNPINLDAKSLNDWWYRHVSGSR